MDPNDVTEINLRLGWPNPRVLPVKLLQEASQLALSKPEAYTRDSLLEYGPDDGFKPLRDKIAAWLTTFYLPSQPITTERICISGGASQNLACVLDTFTDPTVTQSIWMIAPTYFCACRVFDDAGFAGRLHAVPEDPEGLDIRFLSEQLQIAENTRPVSTVATKTRRPWNKTYRHVIYLVPTFANPSGRIMSARRREELVRVARKHDALIVSDDVYDMLGWDYAASKNEGIRITACQPRLVDVDRYLDGGPADEFGNAISNGSFSKIIGPGLRTGWAEATPKFVFGLSQTWVVPRSIVPDLFD
jgi:DNA-binding transcriptional MocR family regulator